MKVVKVWSVLVRKGRTYVRRVVLEFADGSWKNEYFRDTFAGSDFVRKTKLENGLG